MKRWPVVLALAVAPVPRLASAQPHKLLVLQSEGRAAPAIRTKIDAAITRLAAAAEPHTSPGELTFSDAATAVGCMPEAPSCKDDVLGMLAVDEIVITTVTPRPGGLEIAVQRVTRGGAAREARMLLRTGASPDKLDGLAPLFGEKPLLRPTPTPLGPPPAPSGSGTGGPAPAPFGPPPAPTGSGAPTEISQQPGEPPAAPPAAAAATPLFQPAPAAEPPEPTPDDSRRKLALGGMIGGGSAIVLGVLLWAGASSTQDEINAAPTRTQTELNRLRDLESRGDLLATAGNVLVPVGAVVGAVATYFFLRDRGAASSAMARVMPTVLPHGAGIVVRFGGAP